MKCPNCGLINADNAMRCDCGYDFTTRQIGKSYTKTAKEKSRPAIASYLTTSLSSERNNSYAALRSIALLCNGLGYLIVGLSILSALGGLLLFFQKEFVLGFVSIIGAIMSGGLSFIILRVIAEGISVILDIEANTRRAAAVLEDRLSKNL
jgi:hypothetical protein